MTRRILSLLLALVSGLEIAQSESPREVLLVPRGFPTPLIPRGNTITAEKVRVGRYLFYDKRMSVNGRVSCATCHQQKLAFTDGRGHALGATGELHPRAP